MIGLEAYKPYLTYAKDLDDIDPVVALCCRSYYITKYIEAKHQSNKLFTPSESASINELLGMMEEAQKKLGFTKEERKAKVEDFCKKLFDCIVEDGLSAMEVTLQHALQFNTTADLIQLLKLFGDTPHAWEEKRKYCRYNAVVIYKCMKSGIELPRGRPCDAPEIFASVLSAKGHECEYPDLAEFKAEGREPMSVDKGRLLGDDLGDIVIPRTNMRSMVMLPTKLIEPDNRNELKMKDTKPNAKASINDDHIPDEDIVIPLTFIHNKPLVQSLPHKIGKEEPVANSIRKEVESALGEVQFKNIKTVKEHVMKALAKFDCLEI
eukprot:TRINITY_DN7058_c0_g1_i4.p1 TRINITY_DN7058_c0_g1~~TRINITY_DN7058_c0_g1_i4.p1  ORF type:complete len:322 (-),score=81.54 TRINITY_DN7058_c0_g1_i4:125-1090(-)